MRSAATLEVTVVRRRAAMATWFEFRLGGSDPDHLGAVAAAMLDEVERLGRLLSRFDPAGEVARLNRDAAAGPVQLDPEMFALLADALSRRAMTGGYFDAVIPRGGAVGLVQLDPRRRTVRFLRDGVRVDLGGIGKGIALDAVTGLLRDFGVTSALLHGGTSSVRAWGRPVDGPAWVVGLVDPADGATEVGQVALAPGEALSTSGVFDPGSSSTDVVDPTTGQALTDRASCSVVASTATDAEVWSTALLAMGKASAGAFLRTRGPNQPSPWRVAWIDRAGLEWLQPGGTAA